MPAPNERFGVSRGVARTTLCRILEVRLSSELRQYPARPPSRRNVRCKRTTAVRQQKGSQNDRNKQYDIIIN